MTVRLRELSRVVVRVEVKSGGDSVMLVRMRRSGSSRSRPAFDCLEDRRLLSLLDIASGALTYDGSSPSVAASDLTVATTGGSPNAYTFSDTAQAIFLSAGASSAGWTLVSGSGGHEATGPVSSVTSIAIDPASGPANSLTLTSVDAATTVNYAVGAETLNIAATGVASVGSVTVSGPTMGGSLTLGIDAGAMAGTFATGAVNMLSYQAQGSGLIRVDAPSGTVGLTLSNPETAGLTVAMNSLYTTPTALTSTISASGANTTFALTSDTYLFPTADLAAITDGGTAAPQTLTVDYSGGDPLPASGLTYAPPAPTSPAVNSLTLTGGSFTSESYTATGPGAGSITYNGSKTITFSNLTPIFDTVSSPTYTFTAPSGGGQTVDLVNGPTLSVQTAKINDGGSGHFELVDFGNKGAVTLITPGTGNTALVNYSAAAAGMTSLAVNGPAGDSATTNVDAAPSGVPTAVTTGGGGTTTIGAVATGGLPAVQSNVSVADLTGGATLNVSDTGDAAGQTYTLGGSTVTTTATPAVFSYASSVGTVNLTGGSGTNIFNTNDSALVPTDNYLVTGGSGFNTLNVTTTSQNVNVSTPGVLRFGAGNATIDYATIQQINIIRPGISPVGTGVPFTAVEAARFTADRVATFTTTNTAATASDFVASINWGDGSTTSGGAILANGTTSFDITGGHSYAAAGTYPVDVTLTALGNGATSSTVVGATTITFVSGPALSTPNPIVTTATVAAAPLTAQGATDSGIEGLPLASTGGVLVATFTDSGTIQAPSGYTAAINWGDGATTAATSITSQGTPNGVVFSVFGDHAYATPGTDPITVTITKTASGATIVASSAAVIADAPLSASNPQPTISTTEGNPFTGPVATFTDLNPAATVGQFHATIDWGDGLPNSVGTISLAGGVFTVSGSHQYLQSAPQGTYGPVPTSGTFPVKVSILDVFGSKLNLANTANVADQALTVSGGLDPSSNSSGIAATPITNVVQPTFIGSASEPYAKITIFAVAQLRSGPGPLTAVGAGQANVSGSWTITTSTALTNGFYDFYARGVDQVGQTYSPYAFLGGVTIDTLGPKITGLDFQRVQGRISYTIQDFGAAGNMGSGVATASLMDANNYAFTKAHVGRKDAYKITSITVSPGTDFGPQTVTLTINHGHYLRGGRYYITIKSLTDSNTSGIRDLAGNALDGEFYNYFPSGNNVNGGNFAAELNAIHHIIYEPVSTVGTATPVNPPGTLGANTTIPTYNPPPKHARVLGALLVHDKALHHLRG